MADSSAKRGTSTMRDEWPERSVAARSPGIATPAPARALQPAWIAESTLRIPAPLAKRIEVRFAPLSERDRFDRERWRREMLIPRAEPEGWFEIDLDELGLADGSYEYEFVLDGQTGAPVPDPFAEELTRFGGYRGVFHVAGGKRVRPTFCWDDELQPGKPLPGNHQIVIYEMPMRWMTKAPEENRNVDLGTFESALFEHLEALAELGINAIELLPVQDSTDTLNWGYGTRFFFAPDLDMGTPVDLKFFIKQCHRRGIRVILDVVMNHSRKCPLEQLAGDWYYLRDDEEPERDSYGGCRFQYRRATDGGSYPAREFHYQAAEFWVREYHVDGFRIDEFKGINHWEFIQTFRDRATAEQRRLFSDRPFLVIAEDSARRTEIVREDPNNPSGRKVVDATWNFSFRDELRRLLNNRIDTLWGQPARRERIEAFLSGRSLWDDLWKRFRGGFTDLSQTVNYVTSHDVENELEQRLMNFFFEERLRARQLDGSRERVLEILASLDTQPPPVRDAHEEALDRVGSAFALMLTSAGIPMFLAGEEFGDIHDLEHRDWRLKMSDPIDWERRRLPGHQVLRGRVQRLIALRKEHPALQQNETEFFHVHPSIDQNDGERVFAYCRTGGLPLGSPNQVIIVANAGPANYPVYDLPWRWPSGATLREHGAPPRAGRLVFDASTSRLNVPLGAFQVRVFTI